MRARWPAAARIGLRRERWNGQCSGAIAVSERDLSADVEWTQPLPRRGPPIAFLTALPVPPVRQSPPTWAQTPGFDKEDLGGRQLH